MLKSTANTMPSFLFDLMRGRTFVLLLSAWCIYLTALAIHRGLPYSFQLFLDVLD